MKSIFFCFVVLAATGLAPVYAAADRPPSEAVGLIAAFPNGELEDRSQFGRKSEHVEILEGCGLNGSAGVRVRAVGNKSGEFRFECAFRPEHGRKYVFSVCRRIHGRVRPHLAWQCWRKGWCLGQNWNTSVTPLDGGWEREELTLYLKEKEWEEGEIRFFAKVSPPDGVSADPEGWVDYDCASLREDDPEWYLANVWPTHNVIHAETGRVRLHSGFLGRFVPSGSAGEYSVKLKAHGGRTIASRRARPETGTFTVDFGRLAFTGEAVLDVELSDPASGKVCARRSLNVTVAPARKPGPGEVTITEGGALLVDGRPFMPLGFFTSLGKRFGQDRDMDRVRGELAKISGAGFNCIMEYWDGSFAAHGRLTDFYSACAGNGIKVLANFSGAYKTPERMADHVARARRVLESGAPLLGWYVLDEASFTHLPAIRALRRALNGLTPGIPTWQVNIREVEPFLDVADVLGGDHYLIGRHQGVLKQMDSYMALASSCAPAAMWYCPQCFNWANYDRDARSDREKYLAKDDEPTVNEMLAIAFLHAAHGVKGFVFYMYNDIFAGPVPELYGKRWSDVVTVGRVMKSLEPFILSGEPVEMLPVTDVRGRTRVALFRDGRGHSRVLLIGLDYGNEAVFSLPPGCEGLAPVFGNVSAEADGKYRFKAGKRSCDMLKARPAASPGQDGMSGRPF